jgi:hypothetical protein
MVKSKRPAQGPDPGSHASKLLPHAANAVNFYTYSTVAPRTVGLTANYKFGAE